MNAIKSFFGIALIFFGLFPWAGFAMQAGVGVIEGGRLLYCVAPAQGDVEANAAQELESYLEKMVGQLVPPATQVCRGFFRVGKQAAEEAGVIGDGQTGSLGSDGFEIRLVGKDVFIYGDTPRGTLFGVYWLLDRRFGVKWLSPTYTKIPVLTDFILPDVLIRELPRFAFREVLNSEAENKPFRAHNLLNGESHGPSFYPTPIGLDIFDRSWMSSGTYADFWNLLAGYRETYPEWFVGGQLAMMDPAMRAAMADVVVQRLNALPDYRKVWFDIHDMDWGWDPDPASLAFAEARGGNLSAPRLDMMMDIATRVRAVLPDARLAFNAYHWSFTPPEGMNLPDYLMVFPMTIHVDYRSPLNQGNNRDLGRDIARWASISASNVLVWDHIANFSGYLQPTPNIFPIGQSIKWLASVKGVSGYFAEGVWDTLGGEFSALRAWMIARLLWDPTENVEDVVREYCDAYYGKAGPKVFEYIRLMHDAIAHSGDTLAEKTPVDLKMFDAGFIAAADALFDEAERLAAEDADALQHVQAARMPVDFVALVLRHRLGNPGGVSVEARQARLFATLDREGVERFAQGGTIPALSELLAIERHSPSLPEGLPVPDFSELYDIQDLSFNKYENARTVADPAASDGAAIRIGKDSIGWSIQLKLDRLPAYGSWDVYVALRVAGDVPSGNVRVGAYPPMTLFTLRQCEELAGKGYVWVQVPGGALRRVFDHSRGIYIQAADLGPQDAILVDRAVAVRHRSD